MQINGVILANQLSRYFEVASSQCSERYPVNKALFYNEFFEMENCAIVVESGDLNRPLKGIVTASSSIWMPPPLPCPATITTSSSSTIPFPIRSFLIF